MVLRGRLSRFHQSCGKKVPKHADDLVGSLADLAVGESNDAETSHHRPLVAAAIVLEVEQLRVPEATIHFDDEPRRPEHEVHASDQRRCAQEDLTLRLGQPGTPKQAGESPLELRGVGDDPGPSSEEQRTHGRDAPPPGTRERVEAADDLPDGRDPMVERVIQDASIRCCERTAARSSSVLAGVVTGIGPTFVIHSSVRSW